MIGTLPIMFRVIAIVVLLLATTSYSYATPKGGEEVDPETRIYRDTSEILSAVVMDPLGWEISLHTLSARATNIFSLEHPARVVADIPLASAKVPPRLHKPLLIPLDATTCCSAIRIAAHQEKIRVVLDLRSQAVPQFTVKYLDGRVVHLSLEPPGSTITTVHASPTTVAVRVPKAPAAVTALRISPPQATATPRWVESLPSAQPTTSTLRPESTPQAVSPALTRVEFKGLVGGLGQKPHLRLETSHRPHYRILKRASDRYVLRIKDCAVADPRLTLPYFPPQEVDGLNLVHPSVEGNDVVIELRTKRDARVRAVPEERAILVFVE